MIAIMPELAKWDGFYVIVGSAAGAVIGLQFVVLTLIAERSPAGAADAGAAFGSPTIVHFGAVLFLSAMLHAPWQTITIAAALWGLLGFGGIVRGDRSPAHAESGCIQADFRGLVISRCTPLGAYAIPALSAFATAAHERKTLFCVGGAALLLLFIGIHDAWDSVSYHVFVNIAERSASQPRNEIK
jgi:hypothetical protein